MPRNRIAALTLLLLLPAPLAAADRMPYLILWAWERPCDLTAVDPGAVGVAPLALTLRLDADGAALLPRAQPLRFPPGAALVAVARVETDTRRPPRLNAPLAAEVAASIAGLSESPGVTAIQVDFDATASEREFYRELLTALRRRLPARIRLSITALASWCIGDRWLAGLPIDEAVPMLFRMGIDDAQVRHRLDAGEDFAEPLCRASVGLATDEPAPAFPRGRRRYLFLAGGCGPAEVSRALRLLEGDR